MYAALFGLGAAAFRTLFLNSRTRSVSIMKKSLPILLT